MASRSLARARDRAGRRGGGDTAAPRGGGATPARRAATRIFAILLLLAAPQADAGDPPDELEGIHLGDSLGKLDRRYGLRGIVPLSFEDTRRYVVDPDTVPPAGVAEDLLSRDIRKLELDFRGERLVSVSVEYDHERGVMFDEMGRRLRELYGDTDWVRNAGPLRLGRHQGLKLYLWMRTWEWKWPDRKLRVDGKHFGDDKETELPMRHTYVFTLSVSGD